MELNTNVCLHCENSGMREQVGELKTQVEICFDTINEQSKIIDRTNKIIESLANENVEKGKSYSEVLKKSNEIIVVQPKNENQQCKNTEKDIKSKIDLSKLAVGTEKIRNISKGGIAISCASNDSKEKLKESVEKELGDKYKIFEPKLGNPKVIVVGVECDVVGQDNESILEGIIVQNDLEILDDNIKNKIRKKIEEIDYEVETMKTEAKKCDNRCKFYIVQCLDDTQIELIRDKEMVYSMWQSLEERYEKRGVTAQMLLRKKLMSMKLKEAKNLEVFLTEFDEVTRLLTGEKLKRKMYLFIDILRSLCTYNAMDTQSHVYITTCTHELLRDANNEIITVNQNILVKDKISNDIISLPISKEISEIFGFAIQEEVERNVKYNNIENSSIQNKWSHEATLLLLNLCKERYKDLQSNTIRNDIVYKKISEALEKQEYVYTSHQVRDRLKYLKGRYMKWKENMKTSGAAKYNFDYGEILDDILGKKHNICPPAIADTSANKVSTCGKYFISTFKATCLYLHTFLDASGSTLLSDSSDDKGCDDMPSKKQRKIKSNAERRHQERLEVLKDMKTSFQEMFNKLLEKL
ncbi:multifunctional protein ade2 [Holotrichia oblita]|uniref:Multifunctional protein ade2 n=1 Tax=Holotrichia oblita TaxID=644536 RepID=A0ACB9TP95_HOLOL|nr:multifunctional protein ade2 [Holotrichia oblita]